MTKLKIALGDLRHKTLGRYSVIMPLGIGFLAAYTTKMLGPDAVDIRVFAETDELLDELNDWQPDVLGLANYCWNLEVSELVMRHTKEKYPNIITVAGGPNFLEDTDGAEEFLRERESLDFYVYTEGETPFYELMSKVYNGMGLKDLKKIEHVGVKHIDHEGNYLSGEAVPRRKDLNDIPSPYLMGIMDKFFDGNYAPAIQTNRGCPFSCSFCHIGDRWFSQVAHFDVERVKEELTYMAEKMQHFNTLLLLFCDDNFGMYKRDAEIARHIRSLQDTYNWPNSFDVSTGKRNYPQILEVAEILKNKMNVACAVQSLNPATLKEIKRRNLPMDEYTQVQNEIVKRGMISSGEYIVPLPAETKGSFFDAIKTLSNTGVSTIIPHTTMMLSGTSLSSNETREKFGMKTKYRLLSKQFGEYQGERNFESEEICIETNTMTFEEYLECRGFALIISIFISEQFDVIKRHVEEFDIDIYDFLFHLWQDVINSETSISYIYNEYIEESKNELFDSKKDLRDYFSKEENYQKLIRGEYGDNLVRKYRTKLYFERSNESFQLAYEVLKKILGDKLTNEQLVALDNACEWSTKTRNIGSVFNDLSSLENSEMLELAYDIHAWYSEPEADIFSFKKDSSYRLAYDVNHVKPIVEEGMKLYGEDSSYTFSKISTNISPSNFWRKSLEA